MRLITRKLWRAFPELDRFDDSQCQRFVKAAGRSWVHRLVRWGAVLVAFCVGFVLLPVLGLLESEAIDRGWLKSPIIEAVLKQPKWMGDLVYLALLLTLLLATGMLLGAVTRDLMLRRRVRKVLRIRGRYVGCHYFLGGLPVGSDLRVTCPECGFVTEVDSSLGELRKEDDGTVRFHPSEKTIKASTPWLTPARAWKWTKRTAAVVAALALVVGAIAGWNELRVRRQAVRAAAAKRGAPAMNALMEKEQLHAGLPAEPTNAFDKLTPLLAKMAKAEAVALPDGLPNIAGIYVAVDGAAIAERTYPGESEIRVRERGINEELGLKVLAEFRKAGVFEDAREIANADVAIVRLNMDKGVSLRSGAVLANLQPFRRLARWEAARMRLAVRADDPAEFASALDNALGYAHACDLQPTLIGRLVAVAIEALAYREVRWALHERPDAKWLDAMERVLKQRSVYTRPEYVFESERIVAKDTVCWIFADPDMTRLGKYSPRLNTTLRGLIGKPATELAGRLGSLEDNLAAVDAFYDRLALGAQQPRGARQWGAANSNDLVLMASMTETTTKAFDSFDAVAIDRVVTPLLIALERYRLERGEYPAKLEELAPKFLAAVPMDPWTCKSFGYKRTDPKGDAQKRGFLLYSFGKDLTDNGGASGNYAWEALHGDAATGLDMIVNDVDR